MDHSLLYIMNKPDLCITFNILLDSFVKKFSGKNKDNCHPQGLNQGLPN